MPPARQAPARAGVDLEVLLKMQEPLTVHVTRIEGSNKAPIPLEVRQGQIASGVGWTTEDVRGIHSEVLRVAGGGVYEVQVIDSAAAPASMRFTFILDPNLYPRKAPTTMPTMPGVYGTGAPYPYAGVPAAPTALPWGQPAAGLGGYGNRTPIANTNHTDGVAVAQQINLQSEIHRRDLMLLEERHRHELAALQQQQQAAAAASRRDPVVEQQLADARRAAEQTQQRMEQLIAEQHAKAERDAAERRAEERERAREAQAAADRKATEDRFAAIMAQMNQQQVQAQQMMQQMMQQMLAQPKGPDPMVTMLIEQNRATAEAAKETARIEAETQRETARLKSEADRAAAAAQVEAARIAAEGQQRLIATVQAMMAPNQMTPMDAARIVREASTGSDQLVQSAMRTANDMMEMNRNFTSNLLAMAPQGEGTAGRVVGAIEDIAKTWSQNQAQAQAAQAAAMREQAKAEQARIQMAMGGWQAPPPVAPTGAAAPPPSDGAAPSGPLNGNGTQPPQAATSSSAEAPAAPRADVVNATAAAAEPGSVVRMGKTEAAWFGPALNDVMRLRAGVAEYLAAVASMEQVLDQPSGEPITVVHEHGEKAGKPIGLSPFGAARYLVTAAGLIESKNVPVEAFNYFYKQQMYPALVELLLPDAPPDFRSDVLRFFNRLLTGEPIFSENDAPMFGIDRFLGAMDDDEADAAPEPMPTSVNNGRRPAPAGRGR